MIEEKPSAVSIAEKTPGLFEHVSKKKVDGIVGIKKKKKEWIVTIDAVERKATPDTQDLIGRYEVKLDENGFLLGFNQTSIRCRTDMVKKEEAD